MYRSYKKKFRGPDKKSEANVDYWTYARIVKSFNERLSDAMINNCLEFKLPFRLGRVRIKKFKMKFKIDKDGNIDKRKLPVDWKRTKDLWKRIYPGLCNEELSKIDHKQVVYHLNEHSDGYECVLYWNRKGCNVPNNRIYSLLLTFTNKRNLAKALKTNCRLNYYE